MTREEVDMALTGEPPGTFIMRFSERHAGQFGIAYVCSDTKVKHYLVQPNGYSPPPSSPLLFIRFFIILY